MNREYNSGVSNEFLTHRLDYELRNCVDVAYQITTRSVSGRNMG